MEKLYLICKKLICLVILLGISLSFGQNDYVIFNRKGEVKFNDTKNLKAALKGSLIKRDYSLYFKPNDTLVLINSDGNSFLISKPGTYTYMDISQFEMKHENASFSRKYFNYVWNQLTNKAKAKTKVGLVYRNDNVKLLNPTDSVMVFARNLKFEWSSDKPNNYFFLRDYETLHITKIGVSGSYLELFVDNEILVAGKTYQWTIADNEYPDLDLISFNTFTLGTSEDYKKLKEELNVFKKDLKSLGLSESEIKTSLCRDYKVCL